VTERGGQRTARREVRATPRVRAVRSPVRVREATLDDLETVVAMRMALLREHAAHPLYGRLRADAAERAEHLFATQLLSPNEVTLLAFWRDVAIGILRCASSVASPLFVPSHYGYLSSAYVLPAERRRGILRALVTAAESWCTARGLDELRLHNIVDDAVADGAWESLGFEAVEVLRIRRLNR
jgi:GNAT superfamily N-acetyltransferase